MVRGIRTRSIRNCSIRNCRATWPVMVAFLVGILGTFAFVRGWELPGDEKPQSLRPEIRALIAEEVAPLDDRQQVLAYLDTLEGRARHRGRVSALEIEPGFEAIHRFARDDGWATVHHVAFKRRMQGLQSELKQRP